MIFDVDPPLVLRLAADRSCVQREILLGCLYLYSGHAVRSNYQAISRQNLEALLEQAETFDDPWIATWVLRTSALINAPETFEYEAWCANGLSRNPAE